MPYVVVYMGLSGGKQLGIIDLYNGRCNSKDLINSDKTGFDPTHYQS